VVVVLVVPGATLGDGAVVVEAWTSMRGLSLFTEGAVGSVGVTALVCTSAAGAFSRVSVGLDPGADAGEVVCALTRVDAVNKTATT
jgi:hypothetical protein